jgi:hypothetical protein
MDELARQSKEGEGLPSLAQILQETRAAFADVPEEELDRQIDKAIAAARQEMATEREARERKRRASS